MLLKFLAQQENKGEIIYEQYKRSKDERRRYDKQKPPCY
jgi:hypothetical protein